MRVEKLRVFGGRSGSLIGWLDVVRDSSHRYCDCTVSSGQPVGEIKIQVLIPNNRGVRDKGIERVYCTVKVRTTLRMTVVFLGFEAVSSFELRNDL